MYVVSHQRISVDRALGPRRAFAQRLEIGGAVSRAGKAGAAFASALHDVQRGVGFFRAGKARHGTPNNAASHGGVDSGPTSLDPIPRRAVGCSEPNLLSY